MYYVFIAEDGTAYGYIHENDVGDQNIPEPHVIVSELPAALLAVNDGYVCKYRDGGFILEPAPAPEPDKTEQLEQESALLAFELAMTQIRLDQAEQEQAALLLELVSRGVI